MNKELIGGAIGTGLSAVGTATQTNDVLQTISLVITILGGLITFIIVPLITWYREAKKDGKITKDEVEQAKDIVVNGTKEVKDKIEQGKDK